MKLHAFGLDPTTGAPDPHGIPQIACPACRREVNPQFTCRTCPCALEVETHEAVDDLGLPFRVVDSVDCRFAGKVRRLDCVWMEFPNPLAGVAVGARPRREPGVPCALAASGSPDPAKAEKDGRTWAPVSRCGACQFCVEIEGNQSDCSPGEDAGLSVSCAAPTLVRSRQ